MAALTDACAFVASAMGCAGLLLRRHMLKGHLATWHSAPGLVQAALAAQAVFLGMVALSILSGHHASAREAFAYGFTAVVAWIMVVNLDRTGRVGVTAP